MADETKSSPRPRLAEPYVGPCPFERADRLVFRGRDHESQEVSSLIVAHSELLVYGVSGSGKSSLFAAGVIPLLEEKKRFEVLPIARVGGSIPEDMKAAHISNIFVFNALLSWGAFAADAAHATISDCLKNLKRPLADETEDAPRAIIFDQFEQLFTTHLDRSKDREKFLKQVRDALADDPLLRVVFILQEEYLAELQPSAYLFPEHLRARFRLERLNRKAALEAVVGPLEGTGRYYAEGVAEALVEDLLKVQVQTESGVGETITGEFVEPVQLQIVCQGLWRDLPPDVKVITQEHLRKYDVSSALSKYYDSALAEVARETGVSEGKLRDWFSKELITQAGTRGLAYRGIGDTLGLPNEVIDSLEKSLLIRAETRSGARWYELTHDRFISAIRVSNRRWAANKGEPWQALVQLRELCAKRAGGKGPVLRGDEFARAKLLRKTVEDAGFELDPGVAEFIKGSERAEEDRRKYRRFAGYFAVFIVLIGASWANQRLKQLRTAEMALKAAGEIVNNVSQRRLSGDLTVKIANEILIPLNKNIIEGLKDNYNLSAQVDALLLQSDLFVLTQDHKNALELAQRAKSFATSQAAKNPTDDGWRARLYESGFRIGDQLRAEEALEEYQTAFQIAKDRVEEAPDDPERRRRLAFIQNKVGDALFHVARDHVARQANASQALEKFNASLEIGKKLTDKNSEDPESQKVVADAHQRIGKLFLDLDKDRIRDAQSEFMAAIDIQKNLEKNFWSNDIYRGNLSRSYRYLADVYVNQRMFDNALEEYKKALDISAELAHWDPDNLHRQDLAADDYMAMGDAAMSVDPALAEYCYVKGLDIYAKGSDMLKELAAKPDMINKWLQNTAGARLKIADAQKARTSELNKRIDPALTASYLRAQELLESLIRGYPGVGLKQSCSKLQTTSRGFKLSKVPLPRRRPEP